MELDERDHQRMYRVRVLVGDMPLVLVAPILWGPIVESRGVVARRGLEVIVDDVAKFVEDVAGEFVDSILEDIVLKMAGEAACDVCFEEHAPDVWEYRH